MKSMRWIAVYVRVSSRRQDTRSQETDLEKWVEAFSGESAVRWYRDKASGRSMDRPGWRRLEADMQAGRVSKIAVWRLDRLGRTAAGLTTLFELLQELSIPLVSLRDGFDLATPAGRLMAGVLASIAEYENEVRSERVVAGQAAARRAGKRWGGRKPGTVIKLTPDRLMAIRRLRDDGMPIAGIARTVGVSRSTVYAALERV